MSRVRTRCRGFLLLEVLAYLGIVMLIMCAIMGVVASVRRGLVQKAVRERQAEEWAAAAECIRDDLRQARSVKWATESDGSRSLSLTRNDGTLAEYLTVERKLTRSVTRGRKVVQERPFQVDAAIKLLQRSEAGTKQAWELGAVELGREVDASKGAVFFMVTCELRSRAGTPAVPA
ncbi:MAG: hypothetical protein NTW87_33130, partial [Planctomycetota bacterium]|nr:hypothetical protein [Planctomycetota bacterium]